MGKNKKALRKIVVNDIEYKWRVGNFNCDGDWGSKFQIWKDGKKVYEDLIHDIIIMPQNVRDIILEKKL